MPSHPVCGHSACMGMGEGLSLQGGPGREDGAAAAPLGSAHSHPGPASSSPA